jgi:hypothetical protein
LDAKLQTPEELSGLLNIALAGLKRLRTNGWRFSYDKAVEDVEVMYKRNSNPVIAFLMDECEEDPQSYVEKGVFHSRFREYVQIHNIRPITITKFGQLLKDQSVIPLSDYRPESPNGKALPRCWLGVRFKTSTPSIPSIVLPTPSFPEKENEDEIKNIGKIGYIASMEGMEGTGGLGTHPRKDLPTPTKKPLNCIACGADIGPGHGSYPGNLCSSCGPKLPMVRAAVKAHPEGISLSALWEDLASRGRPPLKEHLPAMLEALRCCEDGDKWVAMV